MVASRLEKSARPAGLSSSILMVAIGLLAIASQVGSTRLGAVVIALGVGLLILVGMYGVERDHSFLRSPRSLGYVSLLLLVLTLATYKPLAGVGSAYGIAALALGAIGCFLLVIRRMRPGRLRWVLAVVAGISVGLVVYVALEVMRVPSIDVLWAHEQAAEALAGGNNPYSSIVVQDSNHFAPAGSVFNGYFYWPLPLVWYSLWEWILGDPRWGSAIALAAAVAVLVAPWRNTSRHGFYGQACGLGLALLPAMSIVIRNAWTEPMSFPLLAGAALSWRSRPVMSAVLLGLAIATKQYFLLLVPMLLLWNDEFRWRRLAIVASVVTVTLLPFALLDPQAFWDATIAPHLSRVVRPDAFNIVAFGVAPPSWLAGASAVVVALLLGRRGGGGAAFAVASAATLGVAFFLGYQAFINYWLLITVLSVTALAVAGVEASVPARTMRQKDSDVMESVPSDQASVSMGHRHS